MDTLKIKWRPRDSIPIPQWDAERALDPIDLQVKALHFLFRRYGPLNTAATPNSPEMAPSAKVIVGLSDEELENLDYMYNRTRFEALLLEDKHRVLVDWFKNRFRSMLILPHAPQMEQLPSFRDPSYRFIVLSPDASRDEYVRTLSSSEIYAEHKLPSDIRQATASRCWDQYKPKTQADWAMTVCAFVQFAGVEIQVARLYKASLRFNGPSTSPFSSPGSSLPASPQSKAGKRSGQPAPQLRLKSSQPNLKAQPMRSPMRPTILRASPELSPTLSALDDLSLGSPPHRSDNPIRSGHTSPDRLSPIPRGLSPTLQPSSPIRIKAPAMGSPSRNDLARSPVSASPPKLRLKPSMPTMRCPRQVDGERHGSPKGSSGSSPKGLDLVESQKKQLLSQARLAVCARLDREQNLLDNVSR